MLREWYMHPNGQLPAYEWDFGDVNPPVLVDGGPGGVRYRTLAHRRRPTTHFLERVFEKMLLNFTWWVNRKDALGKNIFQGGFLGMDNIGAFDRGKLPPGYMLGQADGTSWMAAFARSMLSIALLLAERNPVYEDLASKFWEHFVYIANSMNSLTDPKKTLWHEQDGVLLRSFDDARAAKRFRFALARWWASCRCSAQPWSTPIRASSIRRSAGVASGSSSIGPIWSKASGRW